MTPHQMLRATQSDTAYGVRAVTNAITLLMSRDFTLLAIGAHEQAICHRLAVYLEYWFSTYEIDCEYNRMESKIKRVLLDDKKRIVKPDILVHQRLAKSNCLAVEAKATANVQSSAKPTRLIALTKDTDFQYNLALFILIENAKEEILERGYVQIRGTWFNAERIPPLKLRKAVDELTLQWVRQRER